jgi:RecB family exonuclease
MTTTEALVHTALENSGGQQRKAIANLARDYALGSAEGLSAGLTQIAATDAPESQASHYDGIVSGGWMPFPEVVSPSFLETLGNCPLKALFQRVLRVPELGAPPSDALGAADAGSLVHELLAQLYLELFEAGALQPGTDPERATQKARELLPGVIAELAPGPHRALSRRHPTLWTAFEQQLGAAVLDFVERDLGLLLPEGVSELRVEVELRFPLAESRGELEVRGRADRVVRTPSGALRVGDYKTSRDSAPFVRQRNVERGTALQVPLYTLAAASAFDTSAVSGEVLSVPLRPERDRRGERTRERLLDLEAVRASTSRPLGVLHDLLRDGHFPFRAHDGCRYCPYSIACRRSHPPSARRVASYSGFARYLDLQGGTP